jgi:hypothetical protein
MKEAFSGGIMDGAQWKAIRSKVEKIILFC